MFILICVLIILSIAFVAILCTMLVGRANKRKYLPLTKVDMDKDQYDYVMKRLNFQKNFSQPAFLFYNAIKNSQLQEGDLTNLTKYLQDTGAYIGRYKLY